MGEEIESKIIKNPLSNIAYMTLVYFGVIVNSLMMVITFFATNPVYGNPNGYFWFNLSVLLIIPVLGTFLYSLFASLLISRRIVVSPLFVGLLTCFPAVGIGAYHEYEYTLYLSPSARMQSVFGFMFAATLAFLFLFFVAGSPMQVGLRSLIGAYAERSNIESGTLFYETEVSTANILHRLEDSDWLTNKCSLRLVEKKEARNETRAKLQKFETDFYFALYAKDDGSKTLVSIIPYQLMTNPAEKIVFVSQASKESLAVQLDILVKDLQLKQDSGVKSKILRDSANHAMEPARFPAILKYRSHFVLTSVAIVLSIGTFAAYSAQIITDQAALSIIAIIVAIAGTAINIVGRK